MAGAVTVACKLPHGLVLQLQAEQEFDEPVMGGGVRTVKRYVRHGKTVTIKGFAHPRDRAPDVPIQGGYALTYGVDHDFFKAWLLQNKEHPAVEAGLIFASERPAEVEKFARDNAAVLSGLEPVNPRALPPEFQRRIESAEV